MSAVLLIIGNWCLKNKFLKLGYSKAIIHWKISSTLKEQLILAGYYESKYYFHKLIDIPPKITIIFNNKNSSGKIIIHNTIKYNLNLLDLDISPALINYVVEQSYLSNTHNEIIYDFYDSSNNFQLCFDSFNEFNNFSSKFDNYTFFVDSKTYFSLSHTLLVGQTGSGKTYSLYSIILQFLLKDLSFNLYLADPKNSSIAIIGEKNIKNIKSAASIREIINLIDTFFNNMERRKKEIKHSLNKQLDSDYSNFNLSPHVLIIDEYASFTGSLKLLDKKTRDTVDSQIQSIVLMGRQLGCFLWIIMQKSDATSLATQIRDNLMLKIVLGNAETTTYITTYGSSINNEIPKKLMLIGEGVYTYPGLSNKPRLLRFPNLGFNINEAFNSFEKN